MKPTKSMPSYILRAIDPDLWVRVKVRAAQERMPIRAVILGLLELYSTDEIALEATTRD